MTLRSSDLQSDSDLDSIRNSCDVYTLYQVVMLLFVSKVPIVVCSTSALPKILPEVETFEER